MITEEAEPSLVQGSPHQAHPRQNALAFVGDLNQWFYNFQLCLDNSKLKLLCQVVNVASAHDY